VNFNKIKTRVKCIKRKLIVVLIKAMEMYKASLENRKLITICEVIRVNESDLLPLFIIILNIKIIKAEIAQGLISLKAIQITLIRYFNNEVTL
jgi:hypothetical protein